MYKVVWERGAIKDLKSLDKSLAKNLALKIDEFLSTNPEKLGKPLKGQFKQFYSYRYGDYRIIPIAQNK
jgi:mRNA-degrading endonuclease RelE of RelBE toxin-antitoxin system